MGDPLCFALGVVPRECEFTIIIPTYCVSDWEFKIGTIACLMKAALTFCEPENVLAYCIYKCAAFSVNSAEN